METKQMKQKRYKSENQILESIDRSRALESKDIQELEAHHKEITRLRPYDSELATMNYHKGQVEILEKRIRGREGRLERMKQKLAEFRTLTFPGMSEIMKDASIVR